MGVDSTVGELKVQEFFPPQTESYWEQKIVYESLTTDALPEPLEYSQALAERQAERCEKFTSNDVFVGFENQYPTVVSVLECGLAKLTGKPLVTMVKIIQGNQSVYTVSRIWRLEPRLRSGPEVAQNHDPDKSTNLDHAPDNNKKAIPEVIDDPAKLIPKEEFAAWSQTLRDIILCDTNLPAHPCGK